MAADFLGLFRTYVLEQLRRELGPGRGHLVSPGNVAWVLTVPAMWDARAKGSMRDAAVRAGFARKEDPPEQLVIALVGGWVGMIFMATSALPPPPPLPFPLPTVLCLSSYRIGLPLHRLMVYQGDLPGGSSSLFRNQDCSTLIWSCCARRTTASYQ